MTDYSEQGAQPVEDAATDEPPTVDDVLERQRSEQPEQAATSPLQPVDPIEVEAAEIDPRSTEAPEQIEELREDAEALGRDVDAEEPPT